MTEKRSLTLHRAGGPQEGISPSGQGVGPAGRNMGRDVPFGAESGRPSQDLSKNMIALRRGPGSRADQARPDPTGSEARTDKRDISSHASQYRAKLAIK